MVGAHRCKAARELSDHLLEAGLRNAVGCHTDEERLIPCAYWLTTRMGEAGTWRASQQPPFFSRFPTRSSSSRRPSAWLRTYIRAGTQCEPLGDMVYLASATGQGDESVTARHCGQRALAPGRARRPRVQAALWHDQNPRGGCKALSPKRDRRLAPRSSCSRNLKQAMAAATVTARCAFKVVLRAFCSGRFIEVTTLREEEKERGRGGRAVLAGEAWHGV